MKLLAYLSTLNKDQVNEFWNSILELSLIKVLRDLADSYGQKELDHLKNELEKLNQELDHRNSLLDLIKQEKAISATASKLFKEGYRSLNNVIPNFSNLLADHFRNILVDLDALIETN